MITLKSLSIGMAGLTVLLTCASCAKNQRTLPPGDAPRTAPNWSKREYVGMTRREAALKAWSTGQNYRIVEVDGTKTVTKGPRNSDRLNFTIENGVVVKVTKG